MSIGIAVLVHGAWQGTWCWERVLTRLDADGHEAVTPTLAGCGSRADLLTPEVDVETHVSDVVSAIDDLDRDDVVLVGHSYSGMLLPAVAAARSERLRSVVFVDAFYPRRGDSAISLMPPSFQDRFRSIAADEGEGWRLPASEALLDVWGIDDPNDRTWISERMSDWSLVCFESPMNAPTDALEDLPRWFVAGIRDCPARGVFASMAAAAGEAGCSVVEASTGDDVMIEDPDMLTAVIVDALRVR